MRNGRRLFRVSKESDMAYRIPRSRGQDLRDYPTYTVPEAASYLGMSRRTLQSWIADDPIWKVSGVRFAVPLLSFRDVAQAYYVQIVRKHFHLSMAQTREVLRLVRQESRAQYPLLGKNVVLFFKHVILIKPARGKQPRRNIDLTQNRQLGISEVIDLFKTRIQRDKQGEGEKLFPWRYWTPGDETQPVEIDPRVMSGRLVVTGTRIPVQILWNRTQANESIARLADDYKIDETRINLAVSHWKATRDSVPAS
jgi:uncharacterized protein (DUF433 family)